MVRPHASAEVRRRERERGQALVEFALILPLFLALVIGIIQFGVGLNYWLDMQRIANQGARWAVVNKFPGMVPADPCYSDPNVVCTNPDNFQGYLASQPVAGGLNACVEVTFPDGTQAIGDPVKVELSIPFTLFPFLQAWTIKLTADATMRLEQKPGRYSDGLGGTTC